MRKRTFERGQRVVHDEDLLLAVLNSAPMVRGQRVEGLVGSAGEELARFFGGSGAEDELQHLQRTRDALHGVLRKEYDALGRLDSAIVQAQLMPEVSFTGIQWNVHVQEDYQLGVRAMMAWSAVMQELPGRLRECANSECNLFLIDHSRPGTAKWCSMATCGNRMKARSHANRQREG
jgi:predicted RNA-binding Zn ribbon-like protein